MTRENYLIGSVSHGTMRHEDLIPCFVEVLEEHGNYQTHEMLVKEISYRMEKEDYYNSEQAEWDLDELFDALQEIAPPYYYFGSHPGDGADYGFWLCDDVAEMVKGSGGYVVEDYKTKLQLEHITPEFIREDGWPNSGHVEVLHINDHGNCTLYDYDCQNNVWAEIWAIV